MAADAYSRVTGNLGAAISTSGPGATNMITGICCAYYDSIPVIYITGQVATFRLKGNSGVRQLGFQETDVVEICKPITKYAVRVDSPIKIRYELEKAVYLARSGRPGPVLIDIPDNIQREEIESEQLEAFVPEQMSMDTSCLYAQVDRCIHLIKKAKRPVLILGWGIRLAKAEEEAEKLIYKLSFPVAPTWAMMDFLSSGHSLLAGPFGTHGTRYGNFAVQNADLIFAIGARLDTRQTGTPITTFARKAKKIVVDIDTNELKKFKMLGMDVDLLIQADAKDFIQVLNHRIKGASLSDVSDWKDKITTWKQRFPICLPEYHKEKRLNPYVFVKALSKVSKKGDMIFVDTGCAIAWVMQAFEFKNGQRLFHDFNNTAMGYALPASIGACFALKRHPIICITGDGALQMNIQELATVIRHELPIKIFLFNNHGYGMVQQTQEQWLDSRYYATTVEGGLAFPDFVKVAKAYGYKLLVIADNRELPAKIQQVFDMKGPVFCDVEISPKHRVIPLVKFGRPIEDAETLLSRKEFLQNMIVEPISASLK
jgi:acetolactate synthase-1/2/3 large subunit